MRNMFGGIVTMVLGLGLLPVAAQGQTDIAISGYGAFNQKTSGNQTTQSPSDQGGFLVELRHISNPLLGYEATYGYNRANQGYTSVPQACPAFGCSTSTAAIPANQHEVTADWVVSLKVLMLRPFALAGGGVLVSSPEGGTVTTVSCGSVNPLCSRTTTSASTQTQVKGEFTYGAGVDWTVLPHFGLRFQYRGRVSSAPELVTAFSSTNQFTRTSEPVLGAFLRF
jgi:opacity protein-like surface antigen